MICNKKYSLIAVFILILHVTYFAQYIGGSGSGFSNFGQSTISCDKPTQFYPYNGGISSGHSVSTYTLVNCSFPPQFFAYTGGNGSGSSVNASAITNCSTPSQFFAYAGGNGDGFANDATAPISCSTPNQFYAYFGGRADGFARDTFTNCPTQPPVANFSASSQTVCVGSIVNFTDLSTRNPSNWSWSFQGGTPSTSNLQNPSITYNTPGNYSVSLTATNLMGSNTYSVASYITVVALPAANAGNDVSICSGTSTTLTATGGSTYNWTPVNSLSNPSIANPVASPTTTTVYTVNMSNGTCSSLDTVKVTVVAVPTINATNDLSICIGSNTTLSATGGNSYSWVPSTGLSSTTTATTTANPTVTTTYTVTGSNGVCTSKDSVIVTVNSLPTVTVTASGTTTFCQGGSVTLSANTGSGLTYQWRNNGNIISGVSTSTLSVTSSGNYSVVVTNSNNCSATSNAISVTANPNVTPSFTQVSPICVGENLSALPTTSNNNISGNWAPALNNTATTTYTFTPNSGQCAVNTQMTITVNQGTTPTFNQVGPICVGDNLNALPTTSTNGITGNWSPTVNNTATSTYTFTPNAGQCSSTATMTITVNTLPTATVTASGTTTFCQGGSVTLSANTGSGLTYQWRNNGNIISGVSTSTLSVTSSGNYSVVVTNSNNCSSISNAISVTANPNITPSFTQVSPICVGENLSALPTTSNNNISGSWAPALNNTATTTYTFTPNSGQCAVNTQMTITVNQGTTPTFNQVGPICVGDNLNALPTTSTNGITGSWSPTVNNTATTTYTFTPNAGQCAINTQMTITVNSGTTPIFNQVGPVCSGDNLLPLPTTSNNGISGSWSPALNSVSNTTYTFTPNAGQCASTSTMLITVNPRPSATINAASATTFCQGGSVTLNANTGSGLTYEWNTNETTTSINVTTSGNYFVNVTNAFNCSSASNSINVTVHPIGIAQISSSSSTTICEGDSVVLHANLGSSYLWSTGATTQSIVVFNPGTYRVYVGDINNCASTTPDDSVQVIVNQNPAIPTITSNRSTALCIGDTVILTSSLADSYLWNTGANGNSIAVTTQGNYFVTVYNQFGCSTSSSATSVSVNDPLVDFTADTLLVFIPAANVTFTAVTNGVSPYTYNWSFGNGNSSAISSPTTTYFNIGFYDVTLSLSDNTGCTKTITKPNYIQVEQLFPSYPAITNTTEDITSMAYDNPTRGIMTLMNGNCILSTDSGNTWNPVITGNTEPLFCSYTVPGKWFVGGANGTILQSIDNGLNWNPMITGTQQFIKGCGFTSSPVKGYAVGTNGLINYFDGINWNIQTSLTSNDLNGVYVFEDGRAYVAGNQSTILYYNGSSWANQTSPLNFDIKEIRFANQNLGYAVGRNGIILKTTDAGNTWDPSLTGVDVDFNSVEAIGLDSAWATGIGGIVYTTTNAGLSWTRYSVGDTQNQSSLRLKGGKGHIGGNSGNARNFGSGNSGQTVSVNSINFSISINEFKLYPIPANNKVEVSGKLDKTNKLIIQVKDVLGKTIDEKTYVNMEGKVHFILNTSDYLSGVYFLHIQQDNKSWVQKFIIEK